MTLCPDNILAIQLQFQCISHALHDGLRGDPFLSVSTCRCIEVLNTPSHTLKADACKVSWSNWPARLPEVADILTRWKVAEIIWLGKVEPAVT